MHRSPVMSATRIPSSLPSSFRDPSGFVFRHRDAENDSDEGTIHRLVADRYRDDYDLLMGSGLYRELADDGWLIAHEEVDPAQFEGCGDAYRVLCPEQIGFISYPYEWCFSQLKDAALLTLDIQMRALDHGLWLKDASAYNVQFLRGRPIFIDTLSFERYPEGRPWPAYQQFVRHFLGPLALMAHSHIDLRVLLRQYIDGVPVELVSRLLPRHTRLSFSLLTHIHLHAKSIVRHQASESAPGATRSAGVGPTGLRGLVDNLRSAVRKMVWQPKGTEWGDYYGATNYSEVAASDKGRSIDRFIGLVAPKNVWDLGANTGVFSRIASERGIETVAFDMDPAAVEKAYRAVRAAGEENLLPIVMDLTNPSPDLGWNCRERMSLHGRGPADMALALALIHHLCIGNNVPLEMVAAFFRELCQSLLIEFVPKSDSQVQRMLASREDIFDDYTQAGFEDAFLQHFVLRERVTVSESERFLYLFE